MKIAVLPLNVGEGLSPGLGRQISNFLAETLQGAGAETNAVALLAQVAGQPGRLAFVNAGDTLFELSQISNFVEQTKADMVVDGQLHQDQNGAFSISARFHHAAKLSEFQTEEETFAREHIFSLLHWMLKRIAFHAGGTLPPQLAGDEMEFGTSNAEGFIKFLEGFDALNYVQKSKGQVAGDFNPSLAMTTLIESIALDPDFDGPYQTLIELCRLAAQYRIGTYHQSEAALKKVTELIPDDFRAWYALAEISMAINEPAAAIENYEKAIELEQTEPALYTRLGIAQLKTGMPANAERNFLKALELEGPEKPSTDYLASVLTQTGRGHEVPALWKNLVDSNPTEPFARAKYALSLYQAGREVEGERAFEEALTTLDDPAPIKRYYAPVLVNKGELDRAMDFYEDCLDLTPTDVQLLLEYAQTLQKADRDFEIPKVLRDLLASNPDPNTKAQAMAWLIELEEPKRIESMVSANAKMEQNDFEGALNDLKPLKNWLGDYWKMWAMLGAAHNKLGQFEEAEEASRRLVAIYPGCEPAYGELLKSLSAQNKHEDAYNIMRWAAMNLPSSLPVHLNLGLAAKRSGRMDEARALAKQLRNAVGQSDQFDRVLAEIEA